LLRNEIVEREDKKLLVLDEMKLIEGLDARYELKR
jgi:hypothetical protein